MKIRLGISLLASWFCFLFFAGAAAFAVSSRQYVLLPGLLAISGLGFFMVFYFGNIEMDEKGIRQSTLSGRYEIAWDDVKQIETRASDTTVVFRGDDKVLTILGNGHWSDKDAAQAGEIITAQAAARSIPFVEGARSFRFPQGTRIGR